MRADALPGQIRTGITRADRIDSYLRVLHALMLRDMRTRFMGSYWGFLIHTLWPVAHMFIIGGGMTLRGLKAPICENTLLFVATGAVPALGFRYMSREMMRGVLANKPLTYYPQVNTLDVMYSRAMVEFVSSVIGTVLVVVILACLNIDAIPVDLWPAMTGYLCALVLGIGFGSINATIVQIFPGWMIGYLLLSVVLYLISGVMFLPHLLPGKIYDIMKWNPLLQIVEWVRLGYEPLMPVTIDYLYIFIWCGCTLALGLLLERTIGRRGGF